MTKEERRLRELLLRWLRAADTGAWRDTTQLSLAAHPLADETRAVLASTAPQDGPRRLWLSPACEAKSPDGRTWCVNNEWPEGCVDCAAPAVEYVRADIARAEIHELRLLILDGEDAPGAAMAPTLAEIKDLHYKTRNQRADLNQRTTTLATTVRDAVAPLVAIANAFDESALDEHRPEWGVRDPKDVELFSGRGGRKLLTLADCITARDALVALNKGT